MEYLMSEEKTVVLYGDLGDGPHVNVTILDETMWLTQKQMAVVFGASVQTINEHLKNIFREGELTEDSVIRKFRITAQDGKSYNTNHYNLDAVIAVGYRVNSAQATRFRIWATQVLKEYIIKGFALDDDRLKQAKTTFGRDYFVELLERVRSIRASEQRIWFKVAEIFAECSIDYDSNSQKARNFYSHVQNLFHYAITGKTAAEIVYTGADHNKPNMGLTTWPKAPNGRIQKRDTEIAKNYLTEDQIRELESSVSSFFDYIERQIKRRQDFTMESMSEAVEKFLAFNDYAILQGRGKISRKQAVRKASEEYAEFNKHQIIGDDFKKFVNEVKKIANG